MDKVEKGRTEWVGRGPWRVGLGVVQEGPSSLCPFDRKVFCRVPRFPIGAHIVGFFFSSSTIEYIVLITIIYTGFDAMIRWISSQYS